MSDLNYTLVNNYKCKRCGCTHYDKIFYTGAKTLDEENAIMAEQYVCRNCNFPFNITEYTKSNSITMTSDELLNTATIINE